MKATVKLLKADEWQNDNGVVPVLIKARVSYPTLWKPGMYEGAAVNYLGVSAMLEGVSSDDLTTLKKAVLQAARAKYPKIKYKELKDQKLVADSEDIYSLKLRTGIDKPPIFVTTKSKSPIKATHDDQGNCVAPTDPETGTSATETLYAGCWALFKVTLSGDAKKQKVWCNIQAIRFLEDGERFGGDSLTDAVDDMGDVIEDDDEMGDLSDDDNFNTAEDDLGDLDEDFGSDDDVPFDTDSKKVDDDLDDDLDD